MCDINERVVTSSGWVAHCGNDETCEVAYFGVCVVGDRHGSAGKHAISLAARTCLTHCMTIILVSISWAQAASLACVMSHAKTSCPLSPATIPCASPPISYSNLTYSPWARDVTDNVHHLLMANTLFKVARLWHFHCVGAFCGSMACHLLAFLPCVLFRTTVYIPTMSEPSGIYYSIGILVAGKVTSPQWWTGNISCVTDFFFLPPNNEACI